MADVDDIDEYTADEPLVLPARLEREEKYTPWWSALLSPVQTVVAMLPSHKTTRKGRKGARRFRVIVGAVAFVAIVFSPKFWVTIIALLTLIGIVPWLPLPEVQKRAWTNRLKNLRAPHRHTVTRPARVVYDGRRVKLDKGGNTLRRVLTDREAHHWAVGTVNGRLYLSISPETGNKSETVWVGTDEVNDADVDEEIRKYFPEQIDRPALVNGSDWRKLLAVMRALEE